MQLRTKVDIKGWAHKLHYESSILLLGSCFSESIGSQLEAAGFDVALNPLGISFNPVAIAQGLGHILSKKEIQASELHFRDGLWHHWDFHSQFSGTHQTQVLEHMNQSLVEARAKLDTVSHLIVTLGTAWVFHHQESAQVVNNCHKYPSDCFERSLLSSEQVNESLQTLIDRLAEYKPELKIAFTLSPVRHWRDGAQGNSVSKAILRTAIHHVLKSSTEHIYFPSYEIMMDELRDYRFYADDFLHPSKMAQQYIWERFNQVALAEKDRAIVDEIMAFRKMQQHKSLHPDSSADLRFKEQLMQKEQVLLEKYSFLSGRL